MGERWKSIPRVMCKVCKCWFTDNKPGHEFHEGGKRHKEAVELSLKEMRKKSATDMKEKGQMARMMAKIEKDAMAAMKEDIEDNPELADDSTYQKAQKSKGARAEDTQKKEMGRKGRTDGASFGNQVKAEDKNSGNAAAAVVENASVWAECTTEDGKTYYYNATTKLSSWVMPDVLKAKEKKKKKKEEKKASEEGTAGAWESVAQTEVAADSSDDGPKPPSEPFKDELALEDGSGESAISFSEQKATPALKRPAGDSAATVGFKKKRKGNANARARGSQAVVEKQASIVALAEPPPELRIDASDGNPYTKASFVGVYGPAQGAERWEASAMAPAAVKQE